jgi:hypothetical protein
VFQHLLAGGVVRKPAESHESLTQHVREGYILDF